MIPFINDMNLFKDLPDMFSTCQEFLDLGGGDYEEHAILLANYFIYIDEQSKPGEYQTFLVFGYALPEGKTTYVMRKQKKPQANAPSYIEFWNALTGECFAFRQNFGSDGFLGFGKVTASLNSHVIDPMLPLRRIYTLVSQDNVYANKQEYDNPIFMDFDLKNARCWKPFFDSRYSLDLFYPESITNPDSKWSL